jgi:hypothetical protein
MRDARLPGLGQSERGAQRGLIGSGAKSETGDDHRTTLHCTTG